MAFSTKAILPLAILLVLATTQAAHGLVIGGVSINACLVVVGLHCQANIAGTVINNAPALTDITVSVVLNGQVLASANTDLDGLSHITLNTGILSNILSISSLRIRVILPIAKCAIWANTNGILEGPVQVGNVVNGVANLVCNTLSIVRQTT